MLTSCLSSIEVLNYSKGHFEVIIIDDGSTDAAYKDITGMTQQFTCNIRVIRQSNGGPAKARNNGIRNSKEEFVAFTDDDCEVDRNWLLELVKGFTSEDIAGVGGMVVSKNKDILSQYIDYHRILQPPVEDHNIKYLVTANACYRRKYLLDVGGFSEEIENPGGEDPDLSYKIKRLGYILSFNPAGVVVHNHKQDIRSFYRTFYNYGKGIRFLWEKWGEKSLKQLPNAPILEFIKWDNLKAIYGYFKYAGIKKAIPFWILRVTQQYAISRGFKSGYFKA